MARFQYSTRQRQEGISIGIHYIIYGLENLIEAQRNAIDYKKRPRRKEAAKIHHLTTLQGAQRIPGEFPDLFDPVLGINHFTFAYRVSATQDNQVMIKEHTPQGINQYMAPNPLAFIAWKASHPHLPYLPLGGQGEAPIVELLIDVRSRRMYSIAPKWFDEDPQTRLQGLGIRHLRVVRGKRRAR